MTLGFLLEHLDELHDQAEELHLYDLALAVGDLSDRYWWLRHAERREDGFIIRLTPAPHPELL